MLIQVFSYPVVSGLGVNYMSVGEKSADHGITSDLPFPYQNKLFKNQIDRQLLQKLKTCLEAPVSRTMANIQVAVW